jgi:hypothetical protein
MTCARCWAVSLGAGLKKPVKFSKPTATTRQPMIQTALTSLKA